MKHVYSTSVVRIYICMYVRVYEFSCLSVSYYICIMQLGFGGGEQGDAGLPRRPAARGEANQGLTQGGY